MNKRKKCAAPLLARKGAARSAHHPQLGVAHPPGRVVKVTNKRYSANRVREKKSCALKNNSVREDSYFDTVPQDTMACMASYLDTESCRIVLHPGRRRYRTNNRAKIRQQVPSPILNVPGYAFDLLQFGPRSTVDFCIAEKTIWIPRAATLEDFRNIAVVYGPHIKKITMGKLTIPFLQVITKYFYTSLKELDISYEFVVRGTSSDDLNLMEIFTNVGPKLESLCISGYGLRENEVNLLMLSISKCINLKSLKIRGDIVHWFGKSFWVSNVGRTAGNNIENLDIQYKERSKQRWSGLFDEIIVSCPNLKEILIFPKYPLTYADDSTREYFEFLMKLGDQVIRARLFPLPIHMFPLLAEQCPKLRGTLDSAVHLSLTANFLEEIELGFDWRSQFSTLSQHLVYCKNLISFSLKGKYIRPTGLRFHKSMDKLKNLELINCVSSRELILILHFTPSLTRFHVRTTDKIKNGNMFDKVVTLIPDLQDFYISEQPGHQERFAPALFGQLLQAFTAFPLLQKLQFVLYVKELEHVDFRDACMPFRNRRTRIILQGYFWILKQRATGEFHSKRFRSKQNNFRVETIPRLLW